MMLGMSLLVLGAILLLSIYSVGVILVGLTEYDLFAFAARAKVAESNPTLTNPNLNVELLVKGLRAPTSMVFIGPNDILVTQKNDGTVIRIVNGTKVIQPLITVPVASKDERGLLGLDVSNNLTDNKTHAFLFYTEIGPVKGEALGNRIYKYELDKNATKLSKPQLLLDLPWEPGPGHNGGVLKIGPDNNIYVTIGDMARSGSNESQLYETQAQNVQGGKKADGRAGILRITQDGKPVDEGILGASYPLNLYFAYGIKNSFGIDFDPLTGNLWDTENGPAYGDEINLVEPGFNSGWKKIHGIWYVNGILAKTGIASAAPKDLVDFVNKGTYSSPELTWDLSVAPTALKFLDTEKLGSEYKNNILVGDIKFGNIYYFKLNHDRKSLDLGKGLTDKIAQTEEELSDVVFGHGFGGITDLEVGPDGFLYVLVYDKNDGRIYRIHY
jgi:aldose sugar dehydrogenase